MMMSQDRHALSPIVAWNFHALEGRGGKVSCNQLQE